MTSDLSTPDAHSEQAPKKAPAEILGDEIHEAMEALERPAGALFVSALSGGLDVGFSLLLMAAMWTHAHNWLSQPIVKMLVANMYAVGFVFVIVGRSELFTEQTSLAVLPVLRGRSSLRQLARLWAIVYAGNLIGAAAMAAIVTYIAPSLEIANVQSFGHIAHQLADHSAKDIFMSGLLAGWLMGLLSWMVSAARDTISQIVIVWLVTTVIGFTGLHHVVLGTVEVLGGAFSQQGIGVSTFVHFLIWVTLGNALGGSFFVALIKYGHARPLKEAE